MFKLLRELKNTLFLLRKTFLTNYVRVHYSQFGEDIVLGELFGKKRDGMYVDVGCYHPKKYSNTYRLYKRGWHGVNIDMEAHKVRMFDFARPHDFNVVAAVSDKKEVVKMHLYGDFCLGSTIDEECVQRISAKVQNIVEVETRTLDDILENSPYKNKKIDLLSIDAEGNDFKVLKSLNLKVYAPSVIVIEEHQQEIEGILVGQLYAYLKSNGYVLHSWMHLSLIFKREGL